MSQNCIVLITEICFEYGITLFKFVLKIVYLNKIHRNYNKYECKQQVMSQKSYTRHKIKNFKWGKKKRNGPIILKLL